MGQVLAVRYVLEKYLANQEKVFWAFTDTEKWINMLCSRCQECMKLDENCRKQCRVVTQIVGMCQGRNGCE